MTTKKTFENALYKRIKERTIRKKQGKTKLPHISYKSARTLGKEYGFDPRPVTYVLIDLEKRGLIKKVYDSQIDVFRFIAK